MNNVNIFLVPTPTAATLTSTHSSVIYDDMKVAINLSIKFTINIKL
jgi:hypothetical protein